MQDRPTVAEILEAVSEFVTEELLPLATEHRTKFRAMVALNALGIARRELERGEALELEELHELRTLLGRGEAGEPVTSTAAAMKGAILELRAELSRRIRSGETPPGTLQALRRSAARKLMIASPRYLERVGG